MKKCNGCVYESDMKDMLARGYYAWASSEPHPCYGCIRYPSEPLTEDNYTPKTKNRRKGVKNE